MDRIKPSPNIYNPHNIRSLQKAPTKELARLYFAENLSSWEVAKAIGISQAAVCGRLRRAGYALRSPSEGKRLWAKKASPEIRMARVQAAHRQVPINREKRGKCDSLTEQKLFDIIAPYGDFTVQKAVGRYSVDMATKTVAVEIAGGRWNGRRSAAKRTDFILNSGFHVVEIICDRANPFQEIAAYKVISLLNVFQGLPSHVRQHWMIRGSGKFISAREININDWSSIKTLEAPSNWTSLNHS